QGKIIVLQSAEEAIRFYSNRLTLFYRDDLLAKVCRKSSLLTRLYKRFSKKDRLSEPVLDPLATERVLKEIASVAQASGSKFEIVFIPDPRGTERLTSIRENRVWYRKHLRSFTPQVHFCVGKITADDYISKVNQHFTDAGNRKYAAFIDSVVVQ